MKLKLEFEHEEWQFEHGERRLEREEAQKACIAEKAAREEVRELRLAELKEAHELRELELKAEREKRDLEIKVEREKRDLEFKAEQEKALLEAEKEAAAHEHELKMPTLGKHTPSDKASAFDPAGNIRLVPPFQENEVDKYLLILRKLHIV